MVKVELHSTVVQFKELMESNKILKEKMKVRGLNLQQYYEEWYMLGEEEFLKKNLEASKNTEEEVSVLESLDTDKGEEETAVTTNVSSYIDNAVNIVSTISGLMSMFKGGTSSTNNSVGTVSKSLFQFRED